ncbi:protein of unknown function DUF1284 [Methanosalsum zhilinae DSM 4017]|uniref:Iron-sulfur binding protein n=1 Tax=Methanosalsum zhilinae (strain DSM 4017 / NBRC 107636 / OCM 62 / WeN5) TaxID=679901 RepID=F7XP97_METZD|nr:DUF1284 domain-containing protein [Methanosalsum zhilinae]AEH60224.1 protein of unknown function DUF1284 [Methanosalsum zhilinae DSM 4017]
MKRKLIIRAHHLMCIQRFEGYGYTEEFVENMQYIVDMINKNPDIQITIVTECDDICTFCPSNINGKCRGDLLDNHITYMDQQVLDKLKIPENTTLNANEIFQITGKYLPDSVAFEICDECIWKHICFKNISTHMQYK